MALQRFAEDVRRAARIRGEINILITDDSEVRRLNRQFRHKDEATDVLSFPGLEPSLAGDIAISASTAARNARRLGHGAGDEIKILLLHGILHLAGYDHETDNGKMADQEQRLRRKLGLPVSLTERSPADTQRGPKT